MCAMDSAQPAFPFDERQVPEILSVDQEWIEGIEVRPITAKQQLVEVASTVGVEAYELPVEHCGT